MSVAHEPESDGCSIPLFAQCADWAMRLAAKICHGRCVKHDGRYALGGTLDDKLLADMAFCVSVRDDMIAAGEMTAVATGTAAAIFRGLQTHWANGHWKFRHSVERVEQEAP